MLLSQTQVVVHLKVGKHIYIGMVSFIVVKDYILNCDKLPN